ACETSVAAESAKRGGRNPPQTSRAAAPPLPQHAEQAALGDPPPPPAPLPLAGVPPRLLFLDNDELQGEPGVREQLRDAHQLPEQVVQSAAFGGLAADDGTAPRRLGADDPLVLGYRIHYPDGM